MTVKRIFQQEFLIWELVDVGEEYAISMLEGLNGGNYIIVCCFALEKELAKKKVPGIKCKGRKKDEEFELYTIIQNAVKD